MKKWLALHADLADRKAYDVQDFLDGVRNQKLPKLVFQLPVVILRFAQKGIDCKTVGMVEQGLIRVEGVKNARVDDKNYGVMVAYDPTKTDPEKILAAFKKDHPEIPLELPPRKNNHCSQP